MKNAFVILLLACMLDASAFQNNRAQAPVTIPATQPLPPVPAAPAIQGISPSVPVQQVPVQSLPATDPNDLNKSNTANPELLQAPADSTSVPSGIDSTVKKPKN